jgi:uncharacterized protein DUF6316
MMRTRTGEAARPWFRSERYYHTGDGWWFMTRENTELGPFGSQNEAENELVLYIRQINMVGEIPTLRH